MSELTDLETRVVAQSYKAFSESPAGRDLVEYLDLMVDSALNAIRDCTDYRQAADLVVRYQQREGVARELKSRIRNFNAVLESWEEENKTNGNPDDYPDTGSGTDADSTTDTDSSSTGY